MVGGNWSGVKWSNCGLGWVVLMESNSRIYSELMVSVDGLRLSVFGLILSLLVW